MNDESQAGQADRRHLPAKLGLVAALAMLLLGCLVGALEHPGYAEEYLVAAAAAGSMTGAIGIVRQWWSRRAARRRLRPPRGRRRRRLHRERMILDLATHQAGRVTPAEVAVAVEDISILEARAMLDQMVRHGVCALDSDDRGAMFYTFDVQTAPGSPAATTPAGIGQWDWLHTLRWAALGAVPILGYGALGGLLEWHAGGQVIGLSVMAGIAALAVGAMAQGGDRPGPGRTRREQLARERTVLEVAARAGGRVAPADVALAAHDISIAEAHQLLVRWPARATARSIAMSAGRYTTISTSARAPRASPACPPTSGPRRRRSGCSGRTTRAPR